MRLVFKWTKGIGAFGDAAIFPAFMQQKRITPRRWGLAFQDEALNEQLVARKILVSTTSALSCCGNSKLDEFRAAMGLCNLRHIEDEAKKRREKRRNGMTCILGILRDSSATDTRRGDEKLFLLSYCIEWM